MVDLEQFPADVYQTLIALPYRVGLFVSESDKTGGTESKARELSALENVVTFYVEDTLKSEFAQDIMLATLQHKAYWKDWSENIDKVPDECRAIADFLKDRIDDRKLLAFKHNLIEIATTVAMAYRETGATSGTFAVLKKLFGIGQPKKSSSSDAASTSLNISESEKAAINQLAEVFGLSERLE